MYIHTNLHTNTYIHLHTQCIMTSYAQHLETYPFLPFNHLTHENHIYDIAICTYIPRLNHTHLYIYSNTYNNYKYKYLHIYVERQAQLELDRLNNPELVNETYRYAGEQPSR